MQKRILTYISLISLIVTLPMALQAQWENRRVSEEHYESLKESLASYGLMVVLKTNNNKIEAIEKSIENNPQSAYRLKKLLAETQEETQVQQTLMMQKMEEHYQATPIYFVFDTSLKEIRKGKLQNVVVGTNLEIDPSQQLPSAQLSYIITGAGNNNYTNGSEGLLVVHKEGEALIKYDSFGYFFNHLLARNIAEARRLDKALKQLEQGALTLLEKGDKRSYRWVNNFYPTGN